MTPSHPIDALSETAESLVAMAGGYAKMFEAIERGDVLALARVTNLGSGGEGNVAGNGQSVLESDKAAEHACYNAAAAHHNER